MRVCLLLLLGFIVAGCAYTLDGLKPDKLTEFNPADCPGAEGWFKSAGEIRYSRGSHTIPGDLPSVLMHMGMLDPEEINGQDISSEPVYIKMSPEGMELQVKDQAGIEKTFTFFYGTKTERFFLGDNRPYCSLGKLLIREHRFHSNYGETFKNIYRDAVFRFDEKGLTVTIHNKQTYEFGILMVIPWTTTHTSKAEFFFPAIH